MYHITIEVGLLKRSYELHTCENEVEEMAHKTRGEQRNEQRHDSVDHQTKHKGKSPKLYRRRRVDVARYIHELEGDHAKG